MTRVRPLWVLLACLALVSVACGSRRTANEFAAIEAEGFAPDLADPSAVSGGGDLGGLQGGSGGEQGSSDLSGIGGSTGGTQTDTGGSTAGGDTTGADGTTGGTGGGSSSGGAGGTATAGGSTGGGSAGGGGSSGGSTTDGGTDGQQQQNTASDVGVTPTSIKVGNIASRGGPLGPNVFSPPYFGAEAYFRYLNEVEGGVNGRKVEFITCDDKEDPAENRRCVDKLINQDEVFALVANSTRAYDGAEQVSQAGVPDVGGQPIGSEMWTYPGMYTIRGSEYPLNGTVGYQGKLYGGVLQFEYFKAKGIAKAGVIHYDVPESRAFAVHMEEALGEVGIDATRYQVSAALPNWDQAVTQMKADGIQALWDTLDFSGNQNLCRSMERNGLTVKAKISTSQGWTKQASGYAKVCRDVLYAVSESRPNTDESHPGVKRFRQVMKALYPQQFEENLHQWHLEGWAAAKMFTDAVRAQGANLTRKGVEDWLSGQDEYVADGLLSPVYWKVFPFGERTVFPECLVVGRWDDQVGNFVLDSRMPECKDQVQYLDYQPAT